jgi:hypothetical protein
MPIKTAANRGKTAEKKVSEILKRAEATRIWFTAGRVPDAHAAGGRFTPQAGDFAAYSRVRTMPDGLYLSRNFLVEVKELKHEFRLPFASYSADKVARVQKRVLAGSEAIVAILHTTTGLWRLVPFSVFNDRSTGGSWDLRPFAPVAIETALLEFMGLTKEAA